MQRRLQEFGRPERIAVRRGVEGVAQGRRADALPDAEPGFSLSEQSRDALMMPSNLRKAVADETDKLLDATRSLGSAVTTTALGTWTSRSRASPW
ncbi:hypothetical protein ACFSGX_01605 [Sphingomonas arantia]|uniref:Uncharacterized protein n=1 Tax=Sphingomonas arantia TaxID=1460676 RepID=A0ABW4TU42_9SPHN